MTTPNAVLLDVQTPSPVRTVPHRNGTGGFDLAGELWMRPVDQPMAEGQARCQQHQGRVTVLTTMDKPKLRAAREGT